MKETQRRKMRKTSNEQESTKKPSERRCVKQAWKRNLTPSAFNYPTKAVEGSKVNKAAVIIKNNTQMVK